MSISVSTGASCSLFRPWRTAYSTERSAPIPGSNPASKTGRVLSHSSIHVSLYVIKTIKAISIFPSPQVRAYFLSFMGRNQFKKSSFAPPEKSEAEEVRQGKGVPFQHALHTFDTPCTLRCTPKVRHSVQAISRVHGLSRCFLASLHAMHTFFSMTYIYTRARYKFLPYIRLEKWCA